MAEMTDEEAWELSELFAKIPPKVSMTGKGGILMRNKGAKLIVVDDDIVPNYPNVKMFATKKAPVRSFVKKELVMA